MYVYNTWQEMLSIEGKVFTYSKVLMDYSDNGLLPRISLVDYGSMKYVLDLGIQVLSSGDILQTLDAAYDEESYALQLKACETTLKIKDEAFNYIKNAILNNGEISEYEVQKFIGDRFHEEGMIFDDPAIVAIGKNAANPHYFPTKDNCSMIKREDLVLIDMWAKYNHPKGVYADITWMGYVGEVVPDIYKERFEILKTKM